MSDWNVGDLAVCVDDSPCPICRNHQFEVRLNAVHRVAKVSGSGAGLVLEGVAMRPNHSAFRAVRFRKIDKPEACEDEFTVLLKRSRKTVRA